jgi:hypothetical protein
MKRFSPGKFTATATAMTAVVVIAVAAVTGATMTTALASSTATVHHSAKQAKAAKAARLVPGTGDITLAAGRVVSESRDATGAYVTVVTCSGTSTPPPVSISASAPFTVKGVMDTVGVTKALAKRPRGYVQVYTCTVTVLKKLPVCPAGQSQVKGMTGHAMCMTPQEELAWFVSLAVSSSGPKSMACLTAKELAGKGDHTARKAERFACAVKVVLNTGFGGKAGSVSRHHPRK